MGSAVLAKCDCGIEASILIGGGMMNFKTTCFFPCLCENCHGIVQVNLLSETVKCPECGACDLIPYDDPQLSDSLGVRHVAEWNMGNMEDRLGRKLVLTDGKYKCPKCGEMSLRFSRGGLCWD